jgi:hypothetical protein
MVWTRLRARIETGSLAGPDEIGVRTVNKYKVAKRFVLAIEDHSFQLYESPPRPLWTESISSAPVCRKTRHWRQLLLADEGRHSRPIAIR